jgi:hypothetical protein
VSLPFHSLKQPSSATGSRPLKSPVVHQLAAGGHSSAFVTRGPDEIPETYAINLLEKLQQAIGAQRRQHRRGGCCPAAELLLLLLPRRRLPLWLQSARCTSTCPEPAAATAAAAAACPLCAARAAKKISGSSSDKAVLTAALKGVSQGVEMVFGSAAAISAAFGYHDRVGVDVELLEQVQASILGLFSAAAASSDSRCAGCPPGGQGQGEGRCHARAAAGHAAAAQQQPR